MENKEYFERLGWMIKQIFASDDLLDIRTEVPHNQGEKTNYKNGETGSVRSWKTIPTF